MSGAKGIVLAEDAHLVLATAPVDVNSGVSSDVWSMGNASHASIIVCYGVTGGTSAITVEECDDFTPSNTTAIAYASYSEVTAGGDTPATRAATAAGGLTSSANDGIFYQIEVDASQLTDGFPNMRVVIADPSGATFAAILVFLSGFRYPSFDSPTAIA